MFIFCNLDLENNLVHGKVFDFREALEAVEAFPEWIIIRISPPPSIAWSKHNGIIQRHRSFLPASIFGFSISAEESKALPRGRATKLPTGGTEP
jgi:hypothetical protein